MCYNKFKDRKIGKLLTNKSVVSLIGLIPVIGTPAKKILTEVNGVGEGEIVSESGSLNNREKIEEVLKVVIYAVLAYLVVSGKLSQEEAELFKSVAE